MDGTFAPNKICDVAQIVESEIPASADSGQER